MTQREKKGLIITPGNPLIFAQSLPSNFSKESKREWKICCKNMGSNLTIIMLYLFNYFNRLGIIYQK